MAKIILKGVHIEAIEIDGIENPQELLQALGASSVEPKKEEPKKEKVIEPEPVATQVDKPKKKRAARKVAKPASDPKALINVLEPKAADFQNSVRWKQVIEVLVNAGMTDVDQMCELCERLKPDVPIFMRTPAVSERVRLSWEKYQKEMAA